MERSWSQSELSDELLGRKCHRKNDFNFPLHGDEMNTQEMENFAAYKSKKTEAKANWVMNGLGENAGQEVCVQKNTNGLEEGFCKVVSCWNSIFRIIRFSWVKHFEPYFHCFLRKWVTNQNSEASHFSFWRSLFLSTFTCSMWAWKEQHSALANAKVSVQPSKKVREWHHCYIKDRLKRSEKDHVRLKLKIFRLDRLDGRISFSQRHHGTVSVKSTSLHNFHSFQVSKILCDGRIFFWYHCIPWQRSWVLLRFRVSMVGWNLWGSVLFTVLCRHPTNSWVWKMGDLVEQKWRRCCEL